LSLNDSGPPILSIFGGKITTYRKLAEGALSKLAPFFPDAGANWTAGVALPGGDFPVDGVAAQIDGLIADFPFLDNAWARRLVRAYGTAARDMLGDANKAADLGTIFGASLTATEVSWLMQNEFARRAEDVVWRRSKLGLRLTTEEIAKLDQWMQAQPLVR